MDGLFLRQVWAGNEALLQSARARAVAVAGGPTPPTAALLPDQQGTVVAARSQRGVRRRARRAKPDAANFYPADATKDEVEKWMDSLTGRGEGGGDRLLHGDPAWPRRQVRRPCRTASSIRASCALAAAQLREAGALTTQPTLKKFLTRRADAFLSNDYYASDVAWMELDASIEPTIGPYEVYEDEWFGYKAAFEAFITLRDDAETKKLRGVRRRAAGARERAADRSGASAIRSSARSRRSASSTSSSRPATAIAACRRRRSTCRTTSASSRKRAPSA